MLKRRYAVLALIAILIFGAGAAVGRASQRRQQPDFIIDITAPAGLFKAECIRGCKFQVSQPAGVNRFVDSVTDTISTTCPGAEHTVCKTGLSGLISHDGTSPSN